MGTNALRVARNRGTDCANSASTDVQVKLFGVWVCVDDQFGLAVRAGVRNGLSDETLAEAFMDGLRMDLQALDVPWAGCGIELQDRE